MAQINEATKSPSAAFQASAAIKAFSLAAQALERLQNMTWRALGLERDEDTRELPIIEIVDLTEADLLKIRDEQQSENLDGSASGVASSDDDLGTGDESDEIVMEGA
jgi:hypothetical protein